MNSYKNNQLKKSDGCMIFAEQNNHKSSLFGVI